MSSGSEVADRDELVRFLDNLLSAGEGDDYCPNGLQVEGRKSIRRLVTGVSACQELFTRARSLEADAVLVHHGLFWYGAPLPLTGIQFQRVRALIEGQMSLLAYHLPLDRHPEVGNNALGARQLGLTDLRPFARAKGLPVGFAGRFAEPVTAAELGRRCHRVFGQDPLVFAAGPEPIRTLGMVSGGAQRELTTAVEEGLDAFLTGEVSEWVMNVARESGIHYFAAGHYATEHLGVRRLGELVEEEFGIESIFVDVPNPV